MGSGLFWGWGWLAGIGVLVFFGLLLLPWFFFLMNLQALLNNVSPENRRMSPGMVWLNFIPVFHLGWFIYTIIKVKDSLLAEFRTRNWYVDGDLGYNVGLTAGILWVASFFIGWIPMIGWILPLAGAVCWIIYWLKTADLKSRLDTGPTWNRGRPGQMYPPTYPPTYPPYAVRYPSGREFREEGWNPECGPGQVSAGGAAEGPPAAGPDESATAGEFTDNAQAPPDYHCRACGAAFDPGDWFCRKCGSRLH